MKNKIEYTKSSGNVFKDLGLPNPDMEFLRASLSLEVFKILEKRKLTQKEAGKILGIGQPDVSKLMNGNFERFSVERLIKFLTKLDRDIDIAIKRHSSQSETPAGVHVMAM